MSLDLIGALVEVGLDGFDQLVESGSVRGLRLGNGETRDCLPAGDTAETSLVLDDAVRDSHFAAQGGEEEHQLNRVDVVGDADKLSLLLFDQSGDGVYTMTDNRFALGGFVGLASGTSFSTLTETLLLFLLGLGTVLVQELEGLGSCGAVKGGLELIDRGRDLQTGLQHGLLTLKADVFGPFDETAQVALGLDVLADAEVTGTLLEEGVGHSLHLGLLGGQGSGRDFLALILSLLLNQIKYGDLLHY